MTREGWFPDSPAELPLIIGAGHNGEPEELIIMGWRRADGLVPTVSWSSTDWSAPPRVVNRPAERLLDYVERAARAGRSVNQELFLVRAWLRGELSAPPER